jgi:hypothetical protein
MLLINMSLISNQVRLPTARVVSSIELKAKEEKSKADKACSNCVAPVSDSPSPSPVKCLTLEQVNAGVASAKANNEKALAKKQSQ